MQTEAQPEYRIELYWPSRPRDFASYYSLWTHNQKTDRVSKIPTDSKILFYETEKDSFGNAIGAKTVFAAGTLLDLGPEKPTHFTDRDGKVWRESRLVKLDSWVTPTKGVPLSELRAILNKGSNWKMRTGPYPITAQEFHAINNALKLRPETKHIAGGPITQKPHNKPEEYRSIAQKDETESLRQQVAASGTICKLHNILTNQFSDFCKSELKINPEEDVFDILLRIPGERALLIEAKSSSAGNLGRNQVRQAIGQLFDYRFMNLRKNDDTVKLAILLPDKPESSIIELLEGLSIGVIWRLGDSFAATERIRAMCALFTKFKTDT